MRSGLLFIAVNGVLVGEMRRNFLLFALYAFAVYFAVIFAAVPMVNSNKIIKTWSIYAPVFVALLWTFRPTVPLARLSSRASFLEWSFFALTQFAPLESAS